MNKLVARIASVVVLAITMAVPTLPLASAMEPAIPNRSQHGGTESTGSVVLACSATFLTEAQTTTVSFAVAPGVDTPMLVVEQDSGTLYLESGHLQMAQAAPASRVASTSCIAPV